MVFILGHQNFYKIDKPQHNLILTLYTCLLLLFCLSICPSVEPYFILNGNHHNPSKMEDTAAAVGDKEEKDMTVTRTKPVSSSLENLENIGGRGTGTSDFTFYDWVKSKSNRNMEQLLKSYISVHYGLHSAGKRVDSKTDEESEETSMVGKEGDEDEEEENESLPSGRVECRSSVSSDDGSDCERRGGEPNCGENTPSLLKSSGSLSSQKFSDSLTRQAYEKMLALDTRLAKVVRREREVKRARRRLRQKMEEEGILVRRSCHLHSIHEKVIAAFFICGLFIKCTVFFIF